jgi:AcrR family transcriptional regulator
MERKRPGKMEVGKRAVYVREPWKAFQVRQRNLDEKRNAVLQTAAHLFLEQGYRRTSMGELARLLKITKPALYHYFKNKEQIVVDCYSYGIAEIESGLDRALVSHGTGFDKVKAYIEAYATAVVSHEFGRCVAMLDDTALSAATRREVRSLKRRIDEAIRQFLEDGIADGSVGQCNVKLASFAIAGAINWIGTWYQPGGPLSAAEIGQEFAYLLTEGLHSSRAEPGRAIRAAEPAIVRKKQAKATIKARSRQTLAAKSR